MYPRKLLRGEKKIYFWPFWICPTQPHMRGHRSPPSPVLTCGKTQRPAAVRPTTPTPSSASSQPHQPRSSPRAGAPSASSRQPCAISALTSCATSTSLVARTPSTPTTSATRHSAPQTWRNSTPSGALSAAPTAPTGVGVPSLPSVTVSRSTGGRNRLHNMILPQRSCNSTITHDCAHHGRIGNTRRAAGAGPHTLVAARQAQIVPNGTSLHY